MQNDSVMEGKLQLYQNNVITLTVSDFPGQNEGISTSQPKDGEKFWGLYRKLRRKRSLDFSSLESEQSKSRWRHTLHRRSQSDDIIFDSKYSRRLTRDFSRARPLVLFSLLPVAKRKYGKGKTDYQLLFLIPFKQLLTRPNAANIQQMPYIYILYRPWSVAKEPSTRRLH